MTRNTKRKIGLVALLLFLIYQWDDTYRIENAIDLTCDWDVSNECIVPINRVYWWREWDKLYVKVFYGSTLFGSTCEELFFMKDEKIVASLQLRCIDDGIPYYFASRDRGYEEVLPSQKKFAVFRNVDNDGEHFRISFFQDEIEAVKQRQRVKK